MILAGDCGSRNIAKAASKGKAGIIQLGVKDGNKAISVTSISQLREKAAQGVIKPKSYVAAVVSHPGFSTFEFHILPVEQQMSDIPTRFMCGMDLGVCFGWQSVESTRQKILVEGL